MKKINIAYWIVTILFAGFMLFSAIPDATLNEDAIKFMNGVLHYPDYFTRFIGIAKILGVIGILVPGFPRLKEWAYAGLAFDLIGALYSITVVAGVGGGTFFMLLVIAFCFASYILYHKRGKAAMA